VFAADQIVTGTGINLFALGATGLVYQRQEELAVRASSPAFMAAFVPMLAVGLWFYFRRMRGGMELEAIGHAPEAADAAGIAVNRRKLAAICFGGACAGLAGAYLSTMRVSQFTENMTEGQGFLALAIVIFGRWNAVGIVLGGLFFGVVRAYAGYDKLLKMLPYLATLAALAGAAGQGKGPRALGKAYVRQ
jgi:general nucleoside transport system permease protein